MTIPTIDQISGNTVMQKIRSLWKAVNDYFQPKLTEGDNISISEDNVISVTGIPLTIDAELSTESENPVQNKAIANALTNGLATKQDTLVSGTNIKTVNNNSLLGNGNIVISPSVPVMHNDAITDYSDLIDTITDDVTNYSQVYIHITDISGSATIREVWFYGFKNQLYYQDEPTYLYCYGSGKLAYRNSGSDPFTEVPISQLYLSNSTLIIDNNDTSPYAISGTDMDSLSLWYID